MCYCLFGLFSLAYFLIIACLSIMMLGYTINRIISGAINLPIWFVLTNLVWVVIQLANQFVIFAMFKMYDPVYKFVSENLGEFGFCTNRCNCCAYLSESVSS